MGFDMEATWKPKDGKKLKIEDMSDSHIVNAIRSIRRRKDEIIYEGYYDPMGNDHDCEIVGTYGEKHKTQYQMMLFFAYMRGLDVKENV